MKILSIDTPTDETSVAVTEDAKILSNIVWSQASLHAKWGGVVPSLAQRAHEERIDWVIEKAISRAWPNRDLVGNRHKALVGIDAIAVTVGPGLAIALGVGIDKAKELAKKYKKPIIPVNHVEAHLLSPLTQPVYRPQSTDYRPVKFPAYGLAISGGNTQLVLIEKIGKYKVLAQTRDDALGEALDKGARMLGLGYPGGAVLEKMAEKGNPKEYSLPLPMAGQEKEMAFSYSGLKTAFYRLVESEKPLTKEKIYNLAACFQGVAFKHLVRVVSFVISHQPSVPGTFLLVGGGVSANIEVRKRLRKMARESGIKVLFPYTKKLCGDNAAMIGIAAHFKFQRKEFIRDIDRIDRVPKAKLDEKLSFRK